jgi:hypothetical protein
VLYFLYGRRMSYLGRGMTDGGDDIDMIPPGSH